MPFYGHGQVGKIRLQGMQTLGFRGSRDNPTCAMVKTWITKSLPLRLTHQQRSRPVAWVASGNSGTSLQLRPALQAPFPGPCGMERASPPFAFPALRAPSRVPARPRPVSRAPWENIRRRTALKTEGAGSSYNWRGWLDDVQLMIFECLGMVGGWFTLTSWPLFLFTYQKIFSRKPK
jgi:hypothetical protein